MASYIVSYDLAEEGQNCDCLHNKLKAYATHWHMQRSVWIIVTSKNAETIFNDLAKCVNPDDKLFIGKLGRGVVWIGYPKSVSDWIQYNL
jgi:hypothetical protein